MKNFSEIATLVYENAKEIIVPKENYVDETIFLENWFTESEVDMIPTKSGWYWISISNFKNEEFLNLTPKDKPASGCNIPETYGINSVLLNANLLNDKCFYNGHAKNVRSRLRVHFNLTNNDTGALGLNAYPELKEYDFRIKFFTEDMVNQMDVTEETKESIKKLIKSEIGRNIIETSWRTITGFPVLCKA